MQYSAIIDNTGDKVHLSGLLGTEWYYVGLPNNQHGFILALKAYGVHLKLVRVNAFSSDKPPFHISIGFSYNICCHLNQTSFQPGFTCTHVNPFTPVILLLRLGFGPTLF